MGASHGMCPCVRVHSSAPRGLGPVTTMPPLLHSHSQAGVSDGRLENLSEQQQSCPGPGWGRTNGGGGLNAIHRLVCSRSPPLVWPFRHFRLFHRLSCTPSRPPNPRPPSPSDSHRGLLRRPCLAPLPLAGLEPLPRPPLHTDCSPSMPCLLHFPTAWRLFPPCRVPGPTASLRASELCREALPRPAEALNGK